MPRAGSGKIRVTRERLREVLSYDKRTGAFRWKIGTQRSKAGDVAGSVTVNGYRVIGIDGRLYNATRLAWLYNHDEWPEHQIAHRNGDKTDDSIGNLELIVPFEVGRQLSIDRLQKVVRYDQDTGKFYWIWLSDRNRRVKIGDEAGVVSGNGYRYISVDGRKFLAHRLAWYFVTEEWPPELVDHINGDRDDNRIRNLRLANNRQNTRNSGKRSTNTSGYKGVSYHAHSGKWVATITSDYLIHPLGKFDTREEAYAVYCEAANRLHGEFAKT